MRLTNDPGFSFYAFVAVADSAVHVLWYDNRNGNNEIYYKRNMKGNSPITGQNISSTKPDEFSLLQNYPNPFNPNTVISYSVTENRLVTLKVYDAYGREIRTLVNEKQNPGTYEVEFTGNNLSSGVYFYKLTSGDFQTVRRMVLLK
ncbi:MAG: T9SS type A sorting domain-containing protein [Ignavibacteria bacterium]|nr:T9SS type A sorting domain-containing protein [Ignavibacteria bacterium]